MDIPDSIPITARASHVDDLATQLTLLRAEIARTRDWIGHRPSDADPTLIAQTVVRMVELQQQAGAIYRELLALHTQHSLPRQVRGDVLRWAVHDYAELADLVLGVTMARTEHAHQWWPLAVAPVPVAAPAAPMPGVAEPDGPVGAGEPA